LCTNGQAAQVGRELAERDDVRFVALVTGAFDIVAEFVVPSIDRLADILIDDLAAIPNVARSNTELVLRNFMTSYSWATDVENRIHEGTSAAEEANGASSALDPSDLALVREVQNDGRISIARLAATLGISEPAARRRLDALISSRQVLPIALVSPRVLGFSIEALVWCRIDLQELEPTADVLAAYPGVRYVSATNGSYDLVAEMVLRSRDDLDRFRTEFLSHLHAIRRFDISLELRTLKRAYCLLGYERR
jgi:DNA-binding Lrp family transcriptional regulator